MKNSADRDENRYSGNLNKENLYNVPANIWQNMGQEEQRIFEQAFQQATKRREEIIATLSPDCRQEVSAHFAEISASVLSFGLSQLQTA